MTAVGDLRDVRVVREVKELRDVWETWDVWSWWYMFVLWTSMMIWKYFSQSVTDWLSDLVTEQIIEMLSHLKSNEFYWNKYHDHR